ncbi:MAG: general secretion pathway protein GspF [Candidatus Xenobia bacterium]|jgi:type IV pilus assembly protein PilC
MLFTYRCLDEGGRGRDGLLEATSEEAVRAELTRRGWRVVRVTRVQAEILPEARLPSAGPPRVRAHRMKVDSAAPIITPPAKTKKVPSLKALALFTVQFATLLRANVPMSRSLAALSQGDDPAMSQAAYEVLTQVDSGRPLSVAMARLPRVFGPVYVSMIRVAESTGALYEVLGDLGEFLTRLQSRKSRLLAALSYPAFVLLLTFGMLAFLITSMLPRFLDAAGQTGAEVPALTKAVMALAHPAFYLIPLGLVLAIATWWYVARHTPAAQLFFSRLTYEFPLTGYIMRTDLLIRLCRSLGQMLRTGVTLDTALKLLRAGGTGYHKFDAALKAMHEEIAHGVEVSQAMTHVGEFSPVLLGLVTSFENVGNLDAAFLRYSEMTELDLDNYLDSLLQLIEPVLLAFLGVVVGTVMLAAFLPIYQLMQRV